MVSPSTRLLIYLKHFLSCLEVETYVTAPDRLESPREYSRVLCRQSRGSVVALSQGMRTEMNHQTEQSCQSTELDDV